jgi:hypothetical protein
MSETHTGQQLGGKRTTAGGCAVTWPAITKTEIMSKKRHRDRFS